MLDCLKSPFVIHAAMFLENTSNNKDVIRDYGKTLGMSGRRDTEFEVVFCLTIVVRSEKAFFFNYGSH